MGMGWLLSNAKVRGRWREDRKLADRGLSPGAISLNRQCIEEQTRWFLRQLLANPVDFRGHIELSVVLSVGSSFFARMSRTDFKRKSSCLSCTGMN